MLSLFSEEDMQAALTPSLKRRPLNAILFSCVSDPAQACRTAAHKALDDWPVHATDVLDALQPILDGLSATPPVPSDEALPPPATPGRKKARKSLPVVPALAEQSPAGEAVTRGGKGGVAAGLQAMLPALELLQWKAIEEDLLLLDPLQVRA